MKSIRQILNVIDANPSLKAQVEQVAGVPIPPHNSLLSSGCSAVSCAFQNIGKAALYFITFLFVLITSLLFTSILFNEHRKHGNQGHNDNDDAGLLGFIVFVTIFLGEVYFIKKYIWGKIIKCCGCATEEDEEPDYTMRAARAAAGGDIYSPLGQDSVHEMQSYPVQTGTTQVTTTIASPTVVREVRPVSQLTML